MLRRLLTCGLVASIAVLTTSTATGGTLATADPVGELIVGTGAMGTFARDFQTPLGPWYPEPGMDLQRCAVGVVHPGPFKEYRCAIELPLDGVPADARITQATLRLQADLPWDVQQTALYAYAGNGAVTAPDVADGLPGTPLLFTPTVEPSRVDVTSFMTPSVIAAGWVGFSLRQDPLRTQPGTTSAGLYDSFADAYPPTLTIDYALPVPSPSGEASPSQHAAEGIRYVATGGVDAGACTDPMAPCGTIQYAVDQVTAGETVRVAAGTYVGTVNPGPGYAHLPTGVQLAGAGQGQTIVNGPSPCAGSASATPNSIFIGGNAVVLRSLSVGCATAGVQTFASVRVEDVEFLRTGNMGIDTGYGPLVVKSSTFRGRYGIGNRGADLTVIGSAFETTGTGVVALATNQNPGPALTFHANRFAGIGDAIELVVPDGSDGDFGSIDLADNWWGCNEGPAAASCRPIVGGTGIAGADPVASWLELRAIDAPTVLAPGASATLTFGLVGSGTGAVATDFPPTPLTVSPTTGSVMPAAATLMNGRATVTYTAPDAPGMYTVTAALDNGTASVVLNAPVPPSSHETPSVTSTLPPTDETPGEPTSSGTGGLLAPVLMLGAITSLSLLVLSQGRRRRR